jgi:hypothetical protein
MKEKSTTRKFTSPFIFIKKSFEIFFDKENFVFLIKIYLPVGFLALLSLLFTYVKFLANFFTTPSGNITTMVFNLLFVFVMAFVNLIGIMAITKVINKDKFLVRETFIDAFPKYGVFLLLTIVTYLIYALGLILIIVPLIFVVTWFAFSKFINIEKGTGVKASLIDSKKMVKGNFWRVFIRILVFGLFSICAQIVLSILPYGAGVVVFNLFGALFVLPQYLFYKEISSSKVISE